MPYRNKVVRVHRLVLVKDVIALVIPAPRECKRCVRKLTNIKATLDCFDFPTCKYLLDECRHSEYNYPEYKYIANVEFILIRHIRKRRTNG